MKDFEKLISKFTSLTKEADKFFDNFKNDEGKFIQFIEQCILEEKEEILEKLKNFLNLKYVILLLQFYYNDFWINEEYNLNFKDYVPKGKFVIGKSYLDICKQNGIIVLDIENVYDMKPKDFIENYQSCILTRAQGFENLAIEGPNKPLNLISETKKEEYKKEYYYNINKMDKKDWIKIDKIDSKFLYYCYDCEYESFIGINKLLTIGFELKLYSKQLIIEPTDKDIIDYKIMTMNGKEDFTSVFLQNPYINYFFSELNGMQKLYIYFEDDYAINVETFIKNMGNKLPGMIF